MSNYNWGNPVLLEHFKPYINHSFEEIQGSHLSRLIKQLHKKHKNVKNADRYYVVPAVGCTQLLWALGSANPFEHEAPMFSFTKTIMDAFDRYNSKLITSPNNPDGRLTVDSASFLDASYHWAQYYNEGESVPEVENPIILFSYAKLIGDCQERLGWALVDDESVARELHEAIHTLNCGFPRGYMERSVESVVKALDYDMAAPRKELTRRNKECKKILGDRMLSERGMFLYLKSTKKWDKLGIGMNGIHFGGNKNECRINIACDSKDYAELVSKLKEIF